jgi:hypothetical protein
MYIFPESDKVLKVVRLFDEAYDRKRENPFGEEE